MKTKLLKNIIPNFIFLFIIFFLFSLQNVWADKTITFEKNISVPNGTDKGNAVMDIIYANGKIFAYTAARILIYDQSSGNYLDQINFSTGSTGKYGKFQPQFYDKRLWIGDMNLMTVKNDGSNTKIYAVTPLLDIIRISTTAPYLIEYTLPPPESINTFKPMHGINIIKYDNVHHRLYWIIRGRNADACCIGNFHYRERYFAIFDDPGNGNPSLYYHEQMKASTDYLNANITDVEFNLNDNSNNDYFYLSKLDKIEIWEFVSDPSKKIQLVSTVTADLTIYDNYYKFGKLLYIKNDNIGIHKIIALPYRYPSSDLNLGKHPKIYIIDGNHTSDPNSVVVQILDSPSQQILDAVFSTGHQDLIVSYAPDPNELMQTSISDVAVFHFNDQTNSFSNTPTLYNTNHSEIISDNDINSSFKLLNVDQNNVLISKKDEVIQLTYNPTSQEYSNSQLYSGENNFFMQSTKGSINSFVVNEAENGLEVFTNNNVSHLLSKHISFPVYRITADLDGTKQYYFNNLETFNTGLCVYDGNNQTITNINDDQYSNNNIDKPIGDCIYNPFNNCFLISENADFGNNPAKIMALNASDNSLNSEILLVDESNNPAQHPKEMFISPNGKLYVAANMKYTQSTTPKVFVYDATNYTLIKTIDVTVQQPHDPCAFYTAHFCYNKEKDAVYATFLAQEKTFAPYNTMYNTMFDFDAGTSENQGVLVNLDANPVYSATLDFPGKVICPSSENVNETSQFSGKMYIISKTLIVYDYNNFAIQYTNQKLNDIVYSALYDEMFGFEDVSNTCNMDRKAIIYKIETDASGQLTFSPIGDYEGQISSLFINPYDGMLYVHTKFDRYKLGASPSMLLEFDPNAIVGNNYLGAEVLNDDNYPQNRSYYPELDNNPDYHYYNYNLTTPYIDPYTNKMYLPNGGHCNVSVVEFEAKEALTLRPGKNGEPGITWLSIPRHLRPSDPELTPTSTVLAQSNISGGYSQLLLNYNKIIPATHTSGIVNATWSQELDWQYSDDFMRNINSTRGYKLELQPNNAKSLYLYGAVENPNSSFNLYCHLENWIGYFLYEKQNVFDALGSAVDDIYLIQHQDYTCYRYHYPVAENCNEKSATDYPPGTWICDGKPEINYGDMIIVKPVRDISGFQWYNPQQQTTLTDRPEATYYAYEEKAYYATMVIELDTSQTNPVEIGAFVNDTCIGSTGVLTTDSVVVLRAYLEGQPQDSVSFEEHYASRSVGNRKISAYYVLNANNFIPEKRTIKVGEKKDVYLVSFRNKKVANKNLLDVSLIVYPNPAHEVLYFDYHLQNANKVRLEVFNMEGKRIAVLVNEMKNKGTHTGMWRLKDALGYQLKKGLYLINFTTENENVTKKVVMQ